MCLRPQAIDIIRALTLDGVSYVRAAAVKNFEHMQTLEEDNENPVYFPDFSILRGVYYLIVALDPEKYSGHWENSWQPRVIHGLPYEFWEINESTVVDIICWVFIVFPIFFFTLYIYEPRWLRVWRLKQWAKFRGRAQDADLVFD